MPYNKGISYKIYVWKVFEHFEKYNMDELYDIFHKFST